MAQRAPNRDLVDRYEGRDAAGSRRHYFRGWNTLEKWKWGLSAVALVAFVGWLAAGPVGRLMGWGGGSYQYTHGPLASVHAAWDAKCEACHRGFGESEKASLNPFAVQNRWLDLTCGNCHPAETDKRFDHHGNMKWAAGQDGSCAGCHHDHNGRDHSLVRLADSTCTQCHANLAEQSQQYAAKVTDFAGHPEFRKLDAQKPESKHERTIKFSHALHMSEGVVADKANREAKRTPDGKLVQLTCASCHQLDAGRGSPQDSPLLAALAGQPKESILPPRAEGAYFLPVNYEAHCKACHPLGVTVDVSGAKQKGTTVEVPHRKQSGEVLAFLRDRFAGVLLTDNPELADRPAAFRRLNPDAGKPDEANKKFRQAVDDAVGKATEKLFGQTNPASGGRSGATCEQCHLRDDKKAMDVKPVSIPTVWFEHSRFNHVAHRAAACTECHPNTASTAENRAKVLKNEPGWEAEAVNILGVQSCQACHAPASAKGGGVRHGCTDCHRYHNGDAPLQGRGSPHRDPAAPMTTADFLLGRPTAK